MDTYFIFCSFSYQQLAEFQAKEEQEFGAARAKSASATTVPVAASSPPIKPKNKMRVAASGPPPLPLSAHPLMWQEDAVPKLRPSLDADECQVRVPSECYVRCT